MRAAKSKYVLFPFLTAELVLYALYWADPFGQNADAVKYAGIVLCFLVALFFACLGGRSARITCVAFAFTLVSDWFLLIRQDHFEVGLVAFCAVQALYCVRLGGGKFPKVGLPLRFGLAALAWAALAILHLFTLLTALAALYFVNLLMNTADAFLRAKGAGWLFAAGLLLFVGCDVCVGLFNLGAFVSVELPSALYDFAAYGMWGFYFPSQTLIALSAALEDYET